MKKFLLLLTFVLLTTGITTGQEYALEFDSAGWKLELPPDVVTIPEIPDIIGDNDRSIELWVKAYTGQTSQSLILQYGVDEKDEGAGTGGKFTIRLDDAYNIRVEHAFGYIVGSTVINDDAWHHIAVTIDQGSGIHDTKIYVDGALETISDQSGTNNLYYTSSGPIRLSYAETKEGWEIYVRRFNGIIDELRFWKKVLSEEEINSIMDSVVCVDDYEDLVGYFRFNENEGTTVADETGNYNGSLGYLGDGTDTDLHPVWVEGYDITDKDCDEEPPDALSNTDLTMDIIIYPNPVSDYIQIHSEIQISKAVMYDILGSEVLIIESQELAKIDVTSLQSGIYFLQCMTEGDQVMNTVKLVKE